MKIDPYNHKGKWLRWKSKVQKFGAIPDISRQNSDIILRYLNDMELGINTSLGSHKGARSFVRLNNIKQSLIFLSKQFKDIFGSDNLTKLTEEQICSFFVDMRNGIIKRQDGGRYRATRDFVKSFKAFWHWWQSHFANGGAQNHRKTGRKLTPYFEGCEIDFVDGYWHIE